MTKLIAKNTTIPTKASQVFSTAENNQSAVTVHVLQGERDMASANKSLGKFDLADIPPAPRGVPQVEVTFDIDANGILNVSAKDKATGKEQSIIIKASSGLSEEEIAKMVNDAKEHAEEDKKFQELVSARNQADGLIHNSEKSLSDLGDKVDADEKSQIEAVIKDLRSILKSDDKDAIEAKTKELSDLSGKLAEKLYANTGANPADGVGANGPFGESGPFGQADVGQSSQTDQSTGRAKNDEKVVDAEFEEVKDSKK
jgi:molecular chaperone DnaK